MFHNFHANLKFGTRSKYKNKFVIWGENKKSTRTKSLNKR